jgi:hypothetical protein
VTPRANDPDLTKAVKGRRLYFFVMRSKAVAIVLAALAVLLVASNPGKDDFVRWFEGRAKAAAGDEHGLAAALSRLSLLERTLEVKASLRRDNCLLFSVFHVQVLGRDHAFVGVLGGFVGLGDARQAVPGSS